MNELYMMLNLKEIVRMIYEKNTIFLCLSNENGYDNLVMYLKNDRILVKLKNQTILNSLFVYLCVEYPYVVLIEQC